MLTERTIKRRAEQLGYKVSKGYQRYLMPGNAIVRDCNGEPFTGYNVIDLKLNCLAWSCYNEICDHLFTLEDVIEFLKAADQGNLFVW